jgi:hypothetical protein
MRKKSSYQKLKERLEEKTKEVESLKREIKEIVLETEKGKEYKIIRTMVYRFEDSIEQSIFFGDSDNRKDFTGIFPLKNLISR